MKRFIVYLLLAATLFTVISCEERKSSEPTETGAKATESGTETPTQDLSKYEADIALLNSDSFCLTLEMIDHETPTELIFVKKDGKIVLITDDRNTLTLLTQNGGYFFDIENKSYYDYNKTDLNYKALYIGQLTIDSVEKKDGNTTVKCNSGSKKDMELIYNGEKLKSISIYRLFGLPQAVTFDVKSLSGNIPEYCFFEIPEDYEYKAENA